MQPAEFDAMARAQHGHWWYRALAQHLRDILGDGPAIRQHPSRILDAGCGTGANLATLSEAGTVVGVDLSGYALQHARGASGISVACADAATLPFPDAAFDTVVSCDVLCHAAVGDPRAHLLEAARVLRPGGRLLLNLPAYPALMSGHDRAVSNVRRFKREEVRHILHACGFDIMRLTHWNALLLPVAWARRGLRRQSAASDLLTPPARIEQTIGTVASAFERYLLRQCSLPVGLSILVTAGKPLEGNPT